MSRRTTLSLTVTGMTCDHCVAKVTSALRGVAAVEDVEVTLNPGRAVVRGVDLDADQVVRAIKEAGFSASLEASGDCCSTEEPPQEEAPGGAPSTAKGGSFQADLLVVGGGSAGFAAAIRAHELGARVVLINAGTIGGTCVNVGCVPSKTLIRAAEAHHRAAHHRFAGIESTSRVTDFGAIIRQKDELVASLRQAKYVDVLAAYDKVRLVDGRAVFRSANTVGVDGQELRARRIVVTTGSRPWIPPIPGLRESDPLTSTSAFELERLPESVIVLGGRYIALECAQMLARLGARVTILQRSVHLLPTEDDDVTEAVAGYLREEGIQVETSLVAERVAREGEEVVVHARVAGEERRFRAERILAATGRRPITEGMGLEDVGVRVGKDGRIVVDDYLQTTLPAVYGAGDVIGDPAYVYTAAYEGRLAAENALNGNRQNRDYTALPWVIFTDPQVAGVGMNEKEAEREGLEVDVSVLPLSAVPRAIAARDARGFLKLLRPKGEDQLVGARILAPEGSEQIMEASLMIRYGLSIAEVARHFHPYLTQGEGMKLALQAFAKDVKALSCCAH